MPPYAATSAMFPRTQWDECGAIDSRTIETGNSLPAILAPHFCGLHESAHRFRGAISGHGSTLSFAAVPAAIDWRARRDRGKGLPAVNGDRRLSPPRGPDGIEIWVTTAFRQDQPRLPSLGRVRPFACRGINLRPANPSRHRLSTEPMRPVRGRPSPQTRARPLAVPHERPCPPLYHLERRHARVAWLPC